MTLVGRRIARGLLPSLRDRGTRTCSVAWWDVRRCSRPHSPFHLRVVGGATPFWTPTTISTAPLIVGIKSANLRAKARVALASALHARRYSYFWRSRRTFTRPSLTASVNDLHDLLLLLCRQNVGIWLVLVGNAATKAVVWCRRSDSFWVVCWGLFGSCGGWLSKLNRLIKCW